MHVPPFAAHEVPVPMHVPQPLDEVIACPQVIVAGVAHVGGVAVPPEHVPPQITVPLFVCMHAAIGVHACPIAWFAGVVALHVPPHCIVPVFVLPQLFAALVHAPPIA